MLFAIALQLLLPKRLTAGPRWLLPALEAVLLVGLAFASPREVEHAHRGRRLAAVGLTALVSAANITSLALLSHELLHHGSPNGRELIVSGALIWLTNVLIFGLWYWQTDRGGPGRRAAGEDGPPDLLFPQMSDDRIQPVNWRPQFIDYLYVSLTNALALSPTDTMPLSPTRQEHHGDPVARLAGDDRADRRACGEHPAITLRICWRRATERPYGMPSAWVRAFFDG